jgi:hypothetical protein
LTQLPLQGLGLYSLPGPNGNRASATIEDYHFDARLKEKLHIRVRGRLATAAVTAWSLFLSLALEKGWFDVVPNWAIAILLFVPLAIWASLGLTHDRFRGFLRKTRPIVAITTFIVIGAFIGGASGGVLYKLLSRSRPKTAETDNSKSQTDQLFALVVSFQYDDDTRQLNATVAYTNTGEHRRTILDAIFTCRTPDQKPGTFHPLADEKDVSKRVYDTPIYVEPRSEQVHVYKREVDPSLLQGDGNIFGLWVASLSRDSRTTNYTTIEAMRIEPMQGATLKNPEPHIIHARLGSSGKVSLDEMYGSHLIDYPMILGAGISPSSTTQPSPTADKGASPH